MSLLSNNPLDYCFIDTETRSGTDVTEAGAYAHTADPGFCVLIVTYAIGDGPIKVWSIPADTAVIGPDTLLDWRKAPADLAAFVAKARDGQGWFVAWNAGFDRLALNRGLNGRPVGDMFLPVASFICAMVQACRSHLPPDLKGASTVMQCPIPKRPTGKALIQKFCRSDGLTPAQAPEDWAEFLAYAADDIAAMRDIFFATMPLPREEWAQYWVSERINDRGMPVDRAMCEGAALLATLNAELANADVARITGGALWSVNQHAAILAWIMDRLRHLPEVEPILTAEVDLVEDQETGEDVPVPKLSLGKENVGSLIRFLLALDKDQGLTDGEAEALDLLEVREYGASATPKKFNKIVAALVDGNRLCGQYVWNGAATTGRYSSRGVQIHNLTRDTVGTADDELDVAAILCETTPENVQATYNMLRERFGPVGRTLSRMIRPAFMAPEGKRLVWVDWSAIEAVALPWLSASEGGEAVLDVVRAYQADPSLPDLYKVQAGRTLGKDPMAVEKPERQAYGKVPVLSLGYGGGENALLSMAANYGVRFEVEQARAIVRGYREANPWMTDFWNQLFEAASAAYAAPDTEFRAGRVSYAFDPGYMGGTLVCALPCGRLLFYPRIKWEDREVKNKQTGAITRRVSMTYRRGYGRAPLWGGLLAENVTQGACASLLRWSHTVLADRMPGFLVGHTHDENIGLCSTGAVRQSRDLMAQIMRTPPPWGKGLPLGVSVNDHDYYTKTLD